LHQQGWPVPARVQQVGVSRRTVLRYLRTTTGPTQKRRSAAGDSGLNPSTARCWHVGMRAATPPWACCASSNSRATPGAMAWSPRLRAAYARRRVCLLGTAARDRLCPP
jgi:hypothetical protein